MNKLAILILGLFLSFSALASNLSQSSLQGKWLVTEFQGKPDSDGSQWQFVGNKFYQVFDGRRISPDEFKTAPGLIDLDYAKITVKSFDGKVMVAVMAGFKYKLVKQ